MKQYVILACLAIALIQQKADDNRIRKQGQQNARATENQSAAPALSQPSSNAPDQKSSGDTNKNKNQPVSITSVPKIEVKPDEDWVMVICTIVLTGVGIVGTCAAIKTLKQIRRQADTLEDRKTKFDELAQAASRNAQAAILQVQTMQEQITEMSVQSGILQESVGTAKRNIDLIINKERARIRIVKPEKLSLVVGSIVSVEFAKVAFLWDYAALEVQCKVNCILSESRETFTPFIPHGIHELRSVVSSSEISRAIATT